MNALTPRQEAFALEVVRTGNASEAYRLVYNVAGWKPSSVWVSASKLMRHPKVAQRITDLQADAVRAAGITRENALRIAWAHATIPLDEVAPWDENGPHLIPSTQLSREQRLTVTGMKVKRKRMLTGDANGDAMPWEEVDIDIRRVDPLSALEMVRKLAGWPDLSKVEHSGSIGDGGDASALEAIVADPELAAKARELAIALRERQGARPA